MYEEERSCNNNSRSRSKSGKKKKAWESTVQKSQQGLPFGRRRGSMSTVVPASDDTDPDDNDANITLSHAEKLFPNGDFYTGQWHSHLPHGIGKYLWTDGCMYEGQWRHGKTMGRGKFSWPSGASYEGDFKAGFMDGSGTYISPNGDTYKGGWQMNLKNGHGNRRYANGDSYDGEWRSGVQDGHGRYVWKNGNEYVGQWCSGARHGRGSFIWANGNRYDGGWEDGLPMGDGSFRWADGSLYIGIWDKPGAENEGAEEQKGIYYPSPSATTVTARDPRAIFDRDLPQCKVCPGETMGILPSQKRLNWSGAEVDAPKTKGPDAPRPRRRSIDATAGPGGPQGRRPNGRAQPAIGGANNASFGGVSAADKLCIWDNDGDITCEFVDGRSSTDSASGTLTPPRLSRSSPSPIRLPRTGKKQGVTISKGHKNYELMLNLQLGIRHAVGRQAAKSANLDLKSSVFDPKEKIWTKFPPEGSKYTPPHQSTDFKWKDYCPVVFKTLRRLFKVDAADYMLSICGNDALRELSSPGKSGSFFYLTNDDKYMIKTMKKAEVKVLLRMLPAYYNHVRAYENTLVTKFFGLHCVKLTGSAQKKVRFVIMGNLFCSEYHIHRRFDLKGSSHGRTTDKHESEMDENTTLKDLDLNYLFRLHKSWFQEFRRQVDKDCELLEQERIMDYSLLVGVHFRDPRDTASDDGNSKTEIELSKETAPRLSRVDMDQLLADPTRWSTLRLGINMPARVEQTVRRHELELIGEATGEIYDVVLFFGIIDILQDYDISKKLEHAYKSIHYDATSISAVDPKQYSKRFKDFIYKAFVEDT